MHSEFISTLVLRAVLILSCLFVSSSLAADWKGFAGPVAYPTGNKTEAVEVAYIDSDGVIDLIAANADDNNITVYLGNGDGTFTLVGDFAVGGPPEGLAAGHLNADSHIDVVTANDAGDSISVLLGNGDGTFQAPVVLAADNQTVSVAVGLLNDDAHLDIVAANRLSHNVSVFLGNGDGSFGTPTNYSTDSGPEEVVLADMDGLNGLDILTANLTGGDSITILLNDGSGGFGSRTDYSAQAGTNGVAVGYLNDDLILDVAAANSGADSVSVWLGVGGGSMGGRTDLSAGDLAGRLAIADFDRSGTQDIVSINYNDQTVSFFSGVGDGTFEPALDFAGGPAQDVATADVNGDSFTDLLIADNHLDRASVLINRGAGAGPSTPGLQIVLCAALSPVSADPDGGVVRYTYSWTSSGDDSEVVVGPSLRSFCMLYDGDGGATFDVGETWTVEIVATDSDGVEAPAVSGSFVIGAGGEVTFSGWRVL